MDINSAALLQVNAWNRRFSLELSAKDWSLGQTLDSSYRLH